MWLWLVKNPAVAGCGVVIVLLTALTGWLGVNSYALNSEKAALTTKVEVAETEAAKLRLEKQVLNASVANLKIEVDMTKQTQQSLEDAITKLLKLNADQTDSLKEIDNAPASEDGPVAPILRHALDGLRDPS